MGYRRSNNRRRCLMSGAERQEKSCACREKQQKNEQQREKDTPAARGQFIHMDGRFGCESVFLAGGQWRGEMLRGKHQQRPLAFGMLYRDCCGLLFLERLPEIPDAGVTLVAVERQRPLDDGSHSRRDLRVEHVDGHKRIDARAAQFCHPIEGIGGDGAGQQGVDGGSQPVDIRACSSSPAVLLRGGIAG